jgi:hypothetical protein
MGRHERGDEFRVESLQAALLVEDGHDDGERGHLHGWGGLRRFPEGIKGCTLHGSSH